jgi:ABC-type glycerol-3-phosphate transport system permease component
LDGIHGPTTTQITPAATPKNTPANRMNPTVPSSVTSPIRLSDDVSRPLAVGSIAATIRMSKRPPAPTGTTTVLCLTIGTMAAYALVRLRLPYARTILFAMLAATMFPQISIVSPLFLLLRWLRLIDTYPGLILPYLTFALPLAVWLLVGVFRALPPELEESALVDGTTRWGAFTRVALPLAAPGIATAGIVTFLFAWNEFLFALSFTLGADRQTVPVAIALFRGQYQVPWGEVLAASMIATLPVLLVVLLFQRRIVQGLTSGAVRG